VPVDRKTERIRALLGWRNRVLDGAAVVPSVDDLQKIGAAGVLWPPHIDRQVAEPWRKTIEYLFRLVEEGVPDPAGRLPSSLLQPGPPLDGRSAAAPLDAADPVPRTGLDAALAALKAWRAEAVTSGVAGIAWLKESHLTEIVRSGRSTTEEITEVLPARLRVLAGSLARVLADSAATNGRASADEVPSAPDEKQAEIPAPQPPTVPAVEPPTDPEHPTSDEGLSALIFAGYEYPEDPRPPGLVVADPQRGGGVILRWPAADTDAATVIYRVVSGDAYVPYSPDAGESETVAVTTALTVQDDRPFRTAVRHVTIWSHAGTGVEDAASRPPVLHAVTSVVGPVTDLQISEDHGRVVGRWTVLPGTESVRILRIPIEEAAHGAGQPRYRILGDSPNLTGFVDGDVRPGRHYLYQVAAAATVGREGRLLSPSVSAEVKLRAVPAPVTDLRVRLHDHDESPEFDIRWSPPPAGRVDVYRTELPPAAGAGERPLSEAALEQAGLPAHSRLPHPVDALPSGEATMAGVPWPRQWTRAYLTPVTLREGNARVGVTVSMTRTGRIRHPKIIERTHRQVLTFEWPDGAAWVLLYRGVSGHGPGAGPNIRPDDEISASRYENQGGMHLAYPLPTRGCSVHLVPVAYTAGGKVTGSPVSMEYPGLLRMRYMVSTRRTFGTGRPTGVTVQIDAEVDILHAPPFALVHNPDRLPLDIYDGQALFVAPEGDPTAVPVPRFIPHRLAPDFRGLAWTADVRGLGGYVRLFVDLPVGRLAGVALLDPPVSTLRLDSASGRRGRA